MNYIKISVESENLAHQGMEKIDENSEDNHSKLGTDSIRKTRM